MKNKKRSLIILIFSAIIISIIAISLTNQKVDNNRRYIDASFTRGILNDVDVSETVISSTKKEMDYEIRGLKNIADQSIMKYTIKNNSNEYDVFVKVRCNLPSEDAYTITNELDDDTIKKNSDITGSVKVSVTGKIKNNLNFKCHLELDAKEKE